MQLNKAIEAGGNVNQFAHGGTNALHLASMECNKEVVHALLEAGAKVNLASKESPKGWTPLHFAVLFCKAGNGDVVQLLLDAGADPHLTNENGLAPEEEMKLQIKQQQIAEKYKKYVATLKARQNIMNMLKAQNKKTEL